MSSAPVVVVTGGTAGVGRAVVREFASHGARIGIIARGADGLEGARRDVEELGGQAIAIQADVADAEAVESAATKVEEAFGPISIWINNAMCSVFSPVAQMTAAEYRRVTEVTYLGVVHGTLAALRRMTPRNRGTIIQVGSALAYRSIPLQSAYCAAKHAVDGFTGSLRCELIHDRSRIQISMVNLPAMNTPQFDWVRNRLPHKGQPVPPIYEPEVAARAIYHAAYHHRRTWQVGMPTVIAIAGNKLAPGFADQYLGRTGYEAQQTPEPQPQNAPDNLDAPLPGDRGARGRFSDRSQSTSLQCKLDRNRSWLAVGGLVALATAGLLISRPKNSTR